MQNNGTSDGQPAGDVLAQGYHQIFQRSRFSQLAQRFDSMDFVVRTKADECVPEDAGAKGNPLVSVIVPTRNRANWLPRALDSIYAQEELGRVFDIEVIVVDDGSTDATSEVVQRYSAVKYIRLLERRGVSAVLNEGLRASRGRYVTFLADDDEWLRHKLRIQVPLLEARADIGVVYGQSILRFGEEEYLIPEQSRAPSGRVFLLMLMDNFCGHHASCLIRRSAFENAGNFDESLKSYEDWDLSLRLAFYAEFLFIPGAVDIYNLSPHGLWLTREADGTGAEDAVRVIEKALLMLPESAQYAEVRQQARAHVAIETATRMGDSSQALAKVLATLREYPQFLGLGWVQWPATKVLQKCLQANPSARAALETCSKLKTATRNGSATDRRWVQEIVTPIWREVACDSRTSNRDAMRASIRMVANAPFSRDSLNVLVRVIVRAVLGRRTG